MGLLHARRGGDSDGHVDLREPADAHRHRHLSQRRGARRAHAAVQGKRSIRRPPPRRRQRGHPSTALRRVGHDDKLRARRARRPRAGRRVALRADRHRQPGARRRRARHAAHLRLPGKRPRGATNRPRRRALLRAAREGWRAADERVSQRDLRLRRPVHDPGEGAVDCAVPRPRVALWRAQRPNVGPREHLELRGAPAADLLEPAARARLVPH